MNNKTRLFASTFGTIMALAGIEHGIGEIFQGNIAPAGIMILSWPGSEFFRSLGGEPAMTVIPNLLVTGIITVLVSLIFLVWSILFVDRKYGGWVMILLSIAMLLVGAGIFPPIFGILIGVVATRIHVTESSTKVHRSVGIGHFLAKLWPWAYSTCILSWLLLLPGVPLIDYLLEKDITVVMLVVLCIVLSTLLLTLFAGLAYDKEERIRTRTFTYDFVGHGNANKSYIA